MGKWRSIKVMVGVCFFFFALFLVMATAVERWVGVPPYLHVICGSSYRFSVGLPIRVSVGRGGEGRLLLNNQAPHQALTLTPATDMVIRPIRTGQVRLTLRLFGIIPLRERLVEVVAPVKVVPGGHSIGVLLAPQGMIVSGFAPLTDERGRTVFPARDAGLKVGDLITHVDNQLITGADQVAELINRRGRLGGWLWLRVKRGGQVLTVRVRPLPVHPYPSKSSTPQAKEYRIGVYLDDPAAGVGTLSFYDPRTRVFAALGHMISILPRQEQKGWLDGRIVPASIAGIQPGMRGQPGEKIGVFHSRVEMVGRIDKNCPFGIYGRLLRFPDQGVKEPVPVAMTYEVHPGPAEMWTVIEGDKIERFAVEILRVNRQSRPDGKGLVLRITDERLLRRTGGIVQGMSGSPILQDGKLVGAVTHVFVNDPTRGYGILAEWMLVEAGLLPAPLSDRQKSELWPWPRGAAAFSFVKRGEG